jgi:hypothetical protein
MKRMWMAWAIALALGLGTARAGGPPIAGEDLFKWGEYDSLIRVLEPAASAEARTRDDTLIRAKSLLFLGVAFCATGKADRADEAFSRAVELDPQVELDRYYVTQEIANRFQATALRALRRHPASPIAAISAAPAPEAARRTQRPAAMIASPAHHYGWVWLGMGTAAAVTAFAGGYYFFSGHGGGPHEEVTPIDLSHP